MVFNVTRGAKSSLFDPDDVAAAGIIAPHIEAAVSLDIGRSRASAQLAAALFGELDAVALLGTKRLLLYANAAFQTLLDHSRSMSVSNNILEFTGRGLVAEDACDRLLAATTFAAGPPAFFPIAAAPSTSHPRYLMIAPLPPKLVQALNLEPKVVLLNISGTPTVLDRVSEAAALAFGLSRAEARVLDEMVAGRGAEEIAARIGTTPGTIRIQMKAIYAKSGIHRHAELVSYLLTTFEPDLRIGL